LTINCVDTTLSNYHDENGGLALGVLGFGNLGAARNGPLVPRVRLEQDFNRVAAPDGVVRNWNPGEDDAEFPGGRVGADEHRAGEDDEAAADLLQDHPRVGQIFLKFKKLEAMTWRHDIGSNSICLYPHFL
jgi:hypothetical protein